MIEFDMSVFYQKQYISNFVILLQNWLTWFEWKTSACVICFRKEIDIKY